MPCEAREHRYHPVCAHCRNDRLLECRLLIHPGPVEATHLRVERAPRLHVSHTVGRVGALCRGASCTKRTVRKRLRPLTDSKGGRLREAVREKYKGRDE